MRRPRREGRATVGGTIRVRTYGIVAEAVERGIAEGWRRAHKHTTHPTPDAIRDALYDAVMLALSDALIFPELE